jgi:hypothetical protein
MHRPLAEATTAPFEVAHGVIPPRLVDDALRLIHVAWLSEGASAEQLGEWLWATHWFPDLKWRDEITGLAAALPAGWQEGELADPQILLQFPHTGPEPEITFHVDQVPDWAAGRGYLRIVGVPLSPWRQENGGLLVHAGGETVPVEVDPGDAVAMAPATLHSGGVNRTGSLRYAVYFRFLAPA